ncbi:MAG: ion channel [Polyangiales bacterium]
MSNDSPEPSRPPRTALIRPENVRRLGVKKQLFTDLYHHLLTISWPRFLVVVLASYLAVNVLFAALYLLDRDALEGGSGNRALDAFFFSVQTMATIGYGKMTPKSSFANALVTLEALTGMLSMAMATGLLFAKFSRPSARVLFSDTCVVQKRDGVSTLVFRMVNERTTQIVEAQVRVVLLTDEVTREGDTIRRLRDLQLTRSTTPAFSLSWMVLHPITEDSPLYNLDAAKLAEKNASILVSFMGLDDSFNATVHVRKFYTYEELKFGRRFVDILTDGQDARVLDVSRVHLTEPESESVDRASPYH